MPSEKKSACVCAVLGHSVLLMALSPVCSMEQQHAVSWKADRDVICCKLVESGAVIHTVSAWHMHTLKLKKHCLL